MAITCNMGAPIFTLATGGRVVPSHALKQIAAALPVYKRPAWQVAMTQGPSSPSTAPSATPDGSAAPYTRTSSAEAPPLEQKYGSAMMWIGGAAIVGIGAWLMLRK